MNFRHFIRCGQTVCVLCFLLAGCESGFVTEKPVDVVASSPPSEESELVLDGFRIDWLPSVQVDFLNGSNVNHGLPPSFVGKMGLRGSGIGVDGKPFNGIGIYYEGKWYSFDTKDVKLSATTQNLEPIDELDEDVRN